MQLRILTCFCDEEVPSSQATCMTLVVVSWVDRHSLLELHVQTCNCALNSNHVAIDLQSYHYFSFSFLVAVSDGKLFGKAK